MKMLVRLSLALVVVLSLVAIVWAAAPKIQVFDVKPGKVVFKHAEHTTRKDVTCRTCHHKMPPKAKEPTQSCKDCHLEKPKGKKDVGLKDAFHKSCIGCHKARNEGPVKCFDCHQKPQKEKAPGVKKKKGVKG